MLVPHLDAGAAVISLQNGVDNVERLLAVLAADPIAAAVYVGAEMTAPGCVRHTARGDLIIGDLPRRDPGDAAGRRRLESVAALFERAGIACRVSDNVEADLWTKLIINCAYNAISALGRGATAAWRATRGCAPSCGGSWRKPRRSAGPPAC